MFELSYDPCVEKRKEWKSSLSIEIRQKIDELYENFQSIPRLIKLKRNRKPVDIHIGDVFLVSNIEGKYFYGKVLQKVNTEKHPFSWSKEAYVAFIFANVTTEKNLDNFAPNYEELACGPEIFDASYWKKGYLEIIDNIPLTKEEQKLDIGFFKSTILDVGGHFIDANAKKLHYCPKYFNHTGFITYFGVESDLSVATIVYPELLE